MFASKLGASGAEPKRFSFCWSWRIAIRLMVLVADQPCAMRWAPRALMIGAANEEPHQSAQPVVFGSPPGNVGEMKRPRTASGMPLLSVIPISSPPKVATPALYGSKLAALAKAEGTKRLLTEVTLRVVA